MKRSLPTPNSYRCFHCGEVFEGVLAEEHFGVTPDAITKCISSVKSGSFGGPHSPFVPRKLVDHLMATNDQLERELAEAQAEIAEAANTLHDELHTGGHGGETLRSIVSRAVLAYKATRPSTQSHNDGTAHIDHPLRHFDRTCLACWQELDGQPSPLSAIKSPEVRFNEDGTLDEVVSGYCHLEQMDYNHWFLDAGGVAVWLHAKGRITATHERRSAA